MQVLSVNSIFVLLKLKKHCFFLLVWYFSSNYGLFLFKMMFKSRVM